MRAPFGFTRCSKLTLPRLAAIEAAWGFKFEYFDGWPSYFNSTDVQTLTSRGQKVIHASVFGPLCFLRWSDLIYYRSSQVTGTLLTREMNLRYLRELRECNMYVSSVPFSFE